jgi:hypothetical protein
MIAVATSMDDVAETGPAGIAVAPPGGCAQTGDWGVSIADSCDDVTIGVAVTGAHGIAAVGEYGTAQAGGSGVIVCAWEDMSTAPPRRRLTVGYVGEDGILPDTPYTADPTDGTLLEVVL